MIIKTKEFLEAANKILLAAGLDQNAANLELVAKESSLYLNVTNKEFFVSVRFPLETEETFRVVVDASLFLSLGGPEKKHSFFRFNGLNCHYCCIISRLIDI